jgi:3-oxoacyl-[acyl-carrier protein] reductase
MYMSVIDRDPSVTVHPELAGKRVLITGLSAAAGVDVARAFAEHGCRLVLQANTDSPEIVAIAELLNETAGEVRLFAEPLADGEAAVRFAQTAAQTYGGLDIVVNIVPFGRDDLAGARSLAEVEDLVSRKLLPMTLLTRVTANRMRLTLTEGLVLNIVVLADACGPAETAVAGIARAAVAALTRGEAKDWAGDGLRINAIAPSGGVETESPATSLSGDSEIAAVALHLASKQGRRLSGLVFDARRGGGA